MLQPDVAYQRVRAPAYTPHLDPYNVHGGAAFRAGPRRDPLSRVQHLMARSELGRLPNNLPGGQRGHNTFGSAPTAPPGWPGTWESDIEQHSRRGPLQPANSAQIGGLLGGAAGAAHPSLGVAGVIGIAGAPPEPLHMSAHFARQAAAMTEEERRLFLLTGERSRRHAERRWAPTDIFGCSRAYSLPPEPQQHKTPRGEQSVSHIWSTPAPPAAWHGTPAAPPAPQRAARAVDRLAGRGVRWGV